MIRYGPKRYVLFGSAHAPSCALSPTPPTDITRTRSGDDDADNGHGEPGPRPTWRRNKKWAITSPPLPRGLSFRLTPEYNEKKSLFNIA